MLDFDFLILVTSVQYHFGNIFGFASFFVKTIIENIERVRVVVDILINIIIRIIIIIISVFHRIFKEINFKTKKQKKK